MRLLGVENPVDHCINDTDVCTDDRDGCIDDTNGWINSNLLKVKQLHIVVFFVCT